MDLVIFDLDGTLVNTKSGATFRETADDWQWIPGRKEVLHMLAATGVKLGLATNQGGVAFGYLEEHDIIAEIMAVADQGHIDVVRYCLYHPNASIQAYRLDSPDRKPGPGMLLNCMAAMSIGATDTLMVGDRPEDEEAAKAAGVAFAWSGAFFASFLGPT